MKNVLCAMAHQQESMLEEIYTFASKHEWQIELCGRVVPPGWSGDGILSDYLRMNELKNIRNLARTPLVSNMISPAENIRTVACDTREMAKMIVSHFQSKGFRNFAAVDAREWHGVNKSWLDPVAALDEELASCGIQLQKCYWNPRQKPDELTDYGTIIKVLMRFFRRLEKPVALLVPNSMYLTPVYRVLNALKIRVPEEVAVLCNTDNALITEKALIPTSSINGEIREVGRKMADLLQRMMNGENVPKDVVFVTPAAIVSRRSTDVLALSNVKLAVAVAFLMRNYMNFITIEDAAEKAGISTSMLSRLFRRNLGYTPLAFLNYLRMNRIRDLLDGTNLSISEIASQTGYGSNMSLSLAFKRATGMTPGAYRNTRRKGNSNE